MVILTTKVIRSLCTSVLLRALCDPSLFLSPTTSPQPVNDLEWQREPRDGKQGQHVP